MMAATFFFGFLSPAACTGVSVGTLLSPSTMCAILLFLGLWISFCTLIEDCVTKSLGANGAKLTLLGRRGIEEIPGNLLLSDEKEEPSQNKIKNQN